MSLVKSDLEGLLPEFLHETCTGDTVSKEKEYSVVIPDLGEIVYTFYLSYGKGYDNRYGHGVEYYIENLFISCTVRGRPLCVVLRNPSKYRDDPNVLEHLKRQERHRLDAWEEREGIRFPY